MNDSRFVESFQAGGHLPDDCQRVTGRQRLRQLETVGKRRTIQKLHGDEDDGWFAVAWFMASNIEYAADVRVGDSPGQEHLTFEAG